MQISKKFKEMVHFWMELMSQ
ncbi:hypothetical protein E2I00_015985 [Balaenoptera physalus]|uniref:Uncharacterized protein n=1 Tax=Balaenoptera physalus TaxID=9770 RepID=A0A643CBQ1_BALPH|nr:hypothetical protein E2I00_015985 [Balaenoptera physalus]